MGCMFSGKTTEMMKRVRRHEVAQRRCLIIKYARDTRYDSTQDTLVTHDRCAPFVYCSPSFPSHSLSIAFGVSTRLRRASLFIASE